MLDQIDVVASSDWAAFGAVGEMDDVGFTSPIDNFYMTDPISRASATMAACTESFAGTTEKTGTDG